MLIHDMLMTIAVVLVLFVMFVLGFAFGATAEWVQCRPTTTIARGGK